MASEVIAAIEECNDADSSRVLSAALTKTQFLDLEFRKSRALRADKLKLYKAQNVTAKVAQ